MQLCPQLFDDNSSDLIRLELGIELLFREDPLLEKKLGQGIHHLGIGQEHFLEGHEFLIVGLLGHREPPRCWLTA